MRLEKACFILSGNVPSYKSYIYNILYYIYILYIHMLYVYITLYVYMYYI